MKKRYLLCSVAMSLLSSSVWSQIGINTEKAAATLDIQPDKTRLKPDGVIAPRVTLSSLSNDDSKYGIAQTGIFVFVNDAYGNTTNKTANITKRGYYYFDGTLWQPFSSTSQAPVGNPWNKIGSTEASQNVSDGIYNSGQVVIGGTSTSVLDSSASLELEESDKGFLINKVSLQSSTDASTIKTPAHGLLIYNTNTGIFPHGEGIYVNKGTSTSPSWESVTSKNPWNVVGTTNTSQSVYDNIYTVNSAIIGGVGNTTLDPSASLQLESSTKGLLINKVYLQSVTDAATIKTPAKGLLIYNTNTTLSQGEGIYINKGTSASPVWASLLATEPKQPILLEFKTVKSSMSTTFTKDDTGVKFPDPEVLINSKPLADMSISVTIPANSTRTVVMNYSVPVVTNPYKLTSAGNSPVAQPVYNIAGISVYETLSTSSTIKTLLPEAGNAVTIPPIPAIEDGGTISLTNSGIATGAITCTGNYQKTYTNSTNADYTVTLQLYGNVYLRFVKGQSISQMTRIQWSFSQPLLPTLDPAGNQINSSMGIPTFNVQTFLVP